MAKQEKEKQPVVKFISSLAIVVNDIDGVPQHIQIVISQEEETKKWRLMFDVVDPERVPKLAE